MMRYKILLLLFFQLVSAKVTVAASPPIFNNLTIIVSSCDKYAEFWSPFFTFLFKSWPSLLTDNAHVPIILIAGQKEYNDPTGRVTVHHTGQDSDWSAGIANVLGQVKTDYVLYLQDDFIIHKPVNEARLQQLFVAMAEEDVAYLEFAEKFFIDDLQPAQSLGVAVKKKQCKYRTALQAAFWHKSALQWLIKPGEDPWQFEIEGSIRSQGMMKSFWVVVNDYPLVFLNACNLGFWDYGVLQYIQSQGVEVKSRQLPVDKEHPFLRWLQQGYPIIYRGFITIKGWF